MAKNAISKPTAAAVVFPANHRATFDSIAIQNNTSDTITVQVTLANVQGGETPVWANPAAGALTLAIGAVGVVTHPVTAIQFSGAGVGKVAVSEAY